MRTPIGTRLSTKLLCAAALLLALAAPSALAQVKPSGHGGMAMKTIVCRAIPDAQGKAGQELANEIEKVTLEMHRANYAMTGLLAGDPPIACFRSQGDSSKLPMGAR